MAFDKKLLDILACPVSKGPLIYIPSQSILVSKSERLAYPIRDNIPVLLESEAQHLTSDELEKVLAE